MTRCDLDRVRQTMLALRLEAEALGSSDISALVVRLDEQLSEMAGERSAESLNEDTRRALPDACDVDEPAEGDAFTAAYARIDTDVSPRSASVFPGGAP